MSGATRPEPVLAAQGITHRYGGVLALQEVSLGIARASFSAILGPNGAGKSTLALLLGGMLEPTSGRVLRTDATVRVGLVPEGRRLFGQLSVRENLLLGGYGAKLDRRTIASRMDEVLTIMPRSLQEALARPAVTLSGGERQMLALGRALMARPDVILLDEPSLGLAPVLIDKIYEVLVELHRQGTTIVVIEQMGTHALEHASALVVLQRGRVVHEGPATGAAAEEALRSGYVGEHGPAAAATPSLSEANAPSAQTGSAPPEKSQSPLRPPGS